MPRRFVAFDYLRRLRRAARHAMMRAMLFAHADIAAAHARRSGAQLCLRARALCKKGAMPLPPRHCYHLRRTIVCRAARARLRARPCHGARRHYCRCAADTGQDRGLMRHAIATMPPPLLRQPLLLDYLR